MSKTQPITKGNIEDVLLNSCFNETKCPTYNIYRCDNIEIIIRYDKYSNNEYFTLRDMVNINGLCKTNNLDIFLYALQKHIALTPLPAEESIMEWWENNKVEGFNFYEDPKYSYYIESKSLIDWEKRVSPGRAQIPKAWPNDRIKSTILKVCELFKD